MPSQRWRKIGSPEDFALASSGRASVINDDEYGRSSLDDAGAFHMQIRDVDEEKVLAIHALLIYETRVSLMATPTSSERRASNYNMYIGAPPLSMGAMRTARRE